MERQTAWARETFSSPPFRNLPQVPNDSEKKIPQLISEGTEKGNFVNNSGHWDTSNKKRRTY